MNIMIDSICLDFMLASEEMSVAFYSKCDFSKTAVNTRIEIATTNHYPNLLYKG